MAQSSTKTPPPEEAGMGSAALPSPFISGATGSGCIILSQYFLKTKN